MRLDEISQQRLRAGAVAGACLAWSKAEVEGHDPRDLLAAFKVHKKQTKAGERKGAPLMLQALVVVSPEWIAATGDLHDPDNPRNIALFKAAKDWAESWAGEGSVTNARLDLDERGGGVVDVCLAPVRLSRGKPQISTNKPLQELKEATKERNEFAGLQTSWAAYAAEHLDPSIMRGTRKEVTNREHVSPELYGALKDQARREAELEYEERMKAVRSREYELEDARRWFDVGRVLEENALKQKQEEIREQEEAAKATYEKARSLLSRVEALATVTSAEFVKAFGAFRSLTRRLLQKVGWVDENYRFTAEADVSADEKKEVGTALKIYRAMQEAEELKREIAIDDDDDDYDDSGPSGP